MSSLVIASRKVFKLIDSKHLGKLKISKRIEFKAYVSSPSIA